MIVVNRTILWERGLDGFGRIKTDLFHELNCDCSLLGDFMGTRIGRIRAD